MIPPYKGPKIAKAVNIELGNGSEYLLFNLKVDPLQENNLALSNPEKLKQSESGGLTMDATGAENHCTILVIEPSLLEKNVLWAATDDGQVHITKNGGENWTNVPMYF